MRSEHQYISKGVYKHSQISNFVSVKNYMFIRQHGKKCLLIRFSNEMEHSFESLEYTIVQLDSAGKVLGSSEIKYTKLKVFPGENFTTPKAVAVDEYCSDFRIFFKEVHSNRYKYRVKDGTVTAYYVPEKQPIIGRTSNKIDDIDFSVERRRFGKPKLAGFFALIVLLALIAISVIGVFTDAFVSGQLDSGEYGYAAALDDVGESQNVCSLR